MVKRAQGRLSALEDNRRKKKRGRAPDLSFTSEKKGDGEMSSDSKELKGVGANGGEAGGGD